MILMLRDQSFGEFSAHFKQSSVAKFQCPSYFSVIKWVSFERNCGAALVGEYNWVIKFYQLS